MGIGKGEEMYFDGAVCRMIKAGIPLKNPVRLRDGYITVRDGEIYRVCNTYSEDFGLLNYSIII